jgi:hypothetical protein
MNYSQYMRKVAANQSRTIGFQNGQDASMVTLKAQARAQQTRTAATDNSIPYSAVTSFSQVGGTVGNIMENSIQNSSPSNAVCATGYRGTSSGTATVDKTNSVLQSAQHCAVCSDAPSSEPYTVVIPCGIFIDPPQNAPGVTKCCTKDPGVLFSNNSELVSDEARQGNFRKDFGLPNKLQGLRGPIVRSSGI